MCTVRQYIFSVFPLKLWQHLLFSNNTSHLSLIFCHRSSCCWGTNALWLRTCHTLLTVLSIPHFYFKTMDCVSSFRIHKTDFILSHRTVIRTDVISGNRVSWLLETMAVCRSHHWLVDWPEFTFWTHNCGSLKKNRNPSQNTEKYRDKRYSWDANKPTNPEWTGPDS